jgi:hypothetical protein
VLRGLILGADACVRGLASITLDAVAISDNVEVKGTADPDELSEIANRYSMELLGPLNHVLGTTDANPSPAPVVLQRPL